MSDDIVKLPPHLYALAESLTRAILAIQMGKGSRQYRQIIKNVARGITEIDSFSDADQIPPEAKEALKLLAVKLLRELGEVN